MRRKPDLTVPIHDRRQRTRILTLKNFGKLALVGAVAFAVITIRSEMRDPDQGEFGSLYETQFPKVEAKPVEMITETSPVPDETHADPMLVEPAVREQWLRSDESTAPVLSSVATGTTRAEAAVVTGETRVAIVGDTEGVAVVQRERRKPELAGGFGRKN